METSRAADQTTTHVQKNIEKINAENTPAIAIGTISKKEKSTKDLIVEGKFIEWLSEVKYLGIYIDRKLTRKKYIKERPRKSESRLSQLDKIIESRSKLNL